MRNVLKPMKKQFSDFYFLRYGRFFIQNSQDLPKRHHTFQSIAHLSEQKQ